MALIRGFARHTAKTIGNFWVDVTRCTLYVLLPISVIATLLFVWQGSIQNFKGPLTATTLEGTSQVIEQGPLASQLAIKMLGTNGGGFFNANSAHPYENPTPLSNMLQLFLIFSLGAGLTYTFGKMVRDTSPRLGPFLDADKLSTVSRRVLARAATTSVRRMVCGLS